MNVGEYARFCEICTKFIRISNEFHVNLGEFLRFHPLSPFLHMKHPVVRFCLRARVQECNLPDSRAFWAPTAINTGGPQQQELKSAMCNVQKVIVVEKDITSIANFAKWGGSTPHMLFKLPMPGGGGRQYLHVHIFIYKYVQISSVHVRWDRRSRCQRQSYPPAPWSSAPASGALGALLHRLHEIGVHRRCREAVGGGGGGYCRARSSWWAVT